MRHADSSLAGTAGLEDMVDARGKASRKFAVTFLRPGLFCLSAQEVVMMSETASRPSSPGPVVYPLYVLVQ